MIIYDWLVGYLSRRGKAFSLYKRGMAKAKKQDHQGAIDDYTMSIGLRATPPDLSAMVLYHRGLVYVTSGDHRKGTEDLQAVLAMTETLINVKTLARQKLARMAAQASQSIVRPFSLR